MKGFNQIPGLNFNDMFSPVVKMPTVRLMLCLALHFNWEVQQLDVKNAFLHSFVTEQIFMAQPPGFVDPNYPHYVCQLRKALYGLRQSPRVWYSRFSSFLIQHSFALCQMDTSIFVRHAHQSITILLVYDDDILVISNDTKYIQDLLKTLSTNFDMRHLGSMNHFLGLEVQHSPQGIVFSQAAYAQLVLHKAGMLNCKECATPISTKKSVEIESDKMFSDPAFYRSIVGTL